MKRKSDYVGVSLTPRVTKSGMAVYDVRWRERTQVGLRHKCKTFKERSEAEAFRDKCKDKIGIVEHGRSLMHDELVAPGSLDALIGNFLSDLKSRCKASSEHPRKVARYLRRVVREYSLKTTTDINHDLMKRISIDFGRKRTTCTFIRMFLGSFIKWAEGAHAVDRRFFSVKVKRPKPSKTYAWSPEEKLLILEELSRKTQIDIDFRTERFSDEYRKKLSEIRQLEAYRMFFPIFWIQVHWALRPTEAASLRVKDWDSRNHRLFVPAEVAKNGVGRDFVVDPETSQILDSISRDRGILEYLFHGVRVPYFHQRCQSRIMTRVLRKLNIRGRLYSARHHAITCLFKATGGNVMKVQSVSGHLDAKQVETYLHDLDPQGPAILLSQGGFIPRNTYEALGNAAPREH